LAECRKNFPNVDLDVEADGNLAASGTTSSMMCRASELAIVRLAARGIGK